MNEDKPATPKVSHRMDRRAIAPPIDHFQSIRRLIDHWIWRQHRRFCPFLAIGGLVGGAFGNISLLTTGHTRIDPGAFALVGMGTFYGGIAHVPVSSLIMVCELAGSYHSRSPRRGRQRNDCGVSRRIGSGAGVFGRNGPTDHVMSKWPERCQRCALKSKMRTYATGFPPIGAG